MAIKMTDPKAAKSAKAKPAASKAAVPEIRAKVETAVAETAQKIETQFEEGTAKMTNETAQFADRAQAAFGDVNERARTAIEKSTRMFEEVTELTKGNVEALVASSKVAAKGFESLGQEAAEFGRKSFDEASTAFRGFSEIKSPTDLFRLQSEFAKSQFESMIAESTKMSEAMIKLAGDVVEPISSRYSVAAERVKSLAA